MTKLLSLAIVLLIGGGCSSEYDKSLQNVYEAKEKEQKIDPVFDGEVEPKIPNREENDKTILGIDSNGNGIRDDVDIWINRTALNSNERMAMRQYAQKQQERLRACSQKNVNEISKVETDVGSADICLSAVSDPLHEKDFMRLKIFAAVMNTRMRKICPKFFDRYSYSYGGESKDFHEYCNFKIEDKENVIKKYKIFWGYEK